MILKEMKTESALWQHIYTAVLISYTMKALIQELHDMQCFSCLPTDTKQLNQKFWPKFTPPLKLPLP